MHVYAYRTELPRNLTKQLFQAFAARKATKRAMELVCDRCDNGSAPTPPHPLSLFCDGPPHCAPLAWAHSAGDYLERASEDLAAYARHARRSTIDESDVECLLKRCGRARAGQERCSGPRGEHATHQPPPCARVCSHRVVTQNMALPQLLRQQLPRELLERVLPVQQPQ